MTVKDGIKFGIGLMIGRAVCRVIGNGVILFGQYLDEEIENDEDPEVVDNWHELKDALHIKYETKSEAKTIGFQV